MHVQRELSQKERDLELREAQMQLRERELERQEGLLELERRKLRSHAQMHQGLQTDGGRADAKCVSVIEDVQLGGDAPKATQRSAIR